MLYWFCCVFVQDQFTQYNNVAMNLYNIVNVLFWLLMYILIFGLVQNFPPFLCHTSSTVTFIYFRNDFSLVMSVVYQLRKIYKLKRPGLLLIFWWTPAAALSLSNFLLIFWFCTYWLTPHDHDAAWTGACWVWCDLSTMTQSPHILIFIAQVIVPKALNFPHHKNYVCNHFTFILCSTSPPYCSTSVRKTVRRPLRAAVKMVVKPSCRHTETTEAKARQKFM